MLIAAVCCQGLVHAPDQGVDLVLAVAGLATLHIVQALLVNATTGTAETLATGAAQNMQTAIQALTSGWKQ